MNDCVKNDYKDHKLRWDLLPLNEIEDIVKVYTSGADKYGPNKWQGLDDGYNRYKAAMFRHLLDYEKGNNIDEETGCLHLAQVAWNAIAMLYVSKNKEKNNNILKQLDARIEEKINNCNDLLDAIQNVYNNNEIARRNSINGVQSLGDSKQTFEERLIEFARGFVSDINSATSRFRFSYSISPIFNTFLQTNEFDLTIKIEDELPINLIEVSELNNTNECELIKDPNIIKTLTVTEHLVSEVDISNLENKFKHFDKFKECGFDTDTTELIENTKELFNTL